MLCLRIFGLCCLGLLVCGCLCLWYGCGVAWIGIACLGWVLGGCVDWFGFGGWLVLLVVSFLARLVLLIVLGLVFLSFSVGCGSWLRIGYGCIGVVYCCLRVAVGVWLRCYFDLLTCCVAGV